MILLLIWKFDMWQLHVEEGKNDLKIAGKESNSKGFNFLNLLHL